MDVTFATVALCLLELGAADPKTSATIGLQHYSAGVHSVPAHIDTTVARLALVHAGVALDVPTNAQQAYLRTWGGPVRAGTNRDHAE